jgi:hypothetical protein
MTLDRTKSGEQPGQLVLGVWKAIQVVEILREMPAGLRADDLRERAGYSRTTVYRILKTLTACDYILRDSGGVYRLNDEVLLPSTGQMHRAIASTNSEEQSASQNDADVGFEMWGVRFDLDGRRVSAHRRCSND